MSLKERLLFTIILILCHINTNKSQVLENMVTKDQKLNNHEWNKSDHLLNHLNLHHHHLTWLVNNPPFFDHHSSSLGRLVDVRNDALNMSLFAFYIEETIPHIEDPFDGENVDAMEHFFWGKRNGISLELGSLDGSPDTRSVTYDLEKYFGWKRILIDGNPMYREGLRHRSPLAFSAIAPICESHIPVHYAVTSEYVGGILEFMSPNFIAKYHSQVYELESDRKMTVTTSSTKQRDLSVASFISSTASTHDVRNVNLSTIDWSNIKYVNVVECLPLKHILHRVKVKHINFFVLNVQGGELEVLKSIHWNHTIFDVIVVETDPIYRPLHYGHQIISYLHNRGYVNATSQLGRNIWFQRIGFVPSKRPGLSFNCFNGHRHSEYSLQVRINHGGPAFHNCHLKTS